MALEKVEVEEGAETREREQRNWREKNSRGKKKEGRKRASTKERGPAEKRKTHRTPEMAQPNHNEYHGVSSSYIPLRIRSAGKRGRRSIT